MYTVCRAQTDKQREEAFDIRKKVFVEEQHVPLHIELDEHDDEAVHFVLYDDKRKPAGAGRFRIVDGKGKVERVCIDAFARNTGAGTLIMKEMEKFARDSSLSNLVLNAQVTAIPFYEKLGYQVDSGEFMDADIPHRRMVKNI